MVSQVFFIVMIVLVMKVLEETLALSLRVTVQLCRNQNTRTHEGFVVAGNDAIEPLAFKSDAGGFFTTNRFYTESSRMFRSAYCVFFSVLLIGSVFAQVPSPEHLMERWVSWEKSIRTLPPRRLKKEYRRSASSGHSGIEKTVTEMWVSEEFLCNDTETFFSSESVGRSRMRYAVHLLVPDRMMGLGRNRLEERWRITKNVKPAPRRSIFGDLVSVADAVSQRKPPIPAKVATGPDGFPILQIEFSPSAPYRFDGAVPVEMTEVEVTFSGNNQELVPTRIDQKLIINDTTWWMRTTGEDYVDFAGTKVPRLIQRFFIKDSHKEEANFKIDYSLKISEIEEVPIEEIQKRCELAFWQLQDINRAPSNYRVRVFVIVNVLLAIALIYFFASRRRATTRASKS